MIIVTDLFGTNTQPIYEISSDFVMNQSVTGELDVSFTCYRSDKNPGYELLAVESLLEIEGLEFKVKNYSGDGFYKKVYAVSLFFDNTKKRVGEIYTGDNKLTSQLAFILANTGWTYNIDADIADSERVLINFGRNNVIALLKIILERHNIEFQILPNRTIRFSRQIGPTTDFQYRYKHNVESVIRTEDTSNLYTRITGYGADGLSTVYTSPLFFVFGILEAPDYTNNSITDEQVLNDYISTLIKEVPDLSIDSKIPELTERDIGSVIWLIYEPLDIELRTRILRQSKTFVNGELVTREVNFGNTLNRNIIDVIVEQQAKQNEINQGLQNDYVTDESLELQLQALQMRVQEGFDLLSVEVNSFDDKLEELRLYVNQNIASLVASLDEKVDKNRLIQEINSQPTTEKINTSRLDLSGNT